MPAAPQGGHAAHGRGAGLARAEAGRRGGPAISGALALAQVGEHLPQSAQATAQGQTDLLKSKGARLWVSGALERKALTQSWVIWGVSEGKEVTNLQ